MPTESTPPDLLDPILIGGTGRSGTTVLARLMRRHPNVFTFEWETQLMVSPGGLVDLVTKGQTEERVTRFVDNLHGRWFRRTVRPGTPSEYVAGLCSDLTEGELQEATERFLKAVGRDDSPSTVDLARNLVVDLASGAVRRANAHRWAEKTPRNILYAGALLEMFPRGKIIHIIRDGRDVAASLVARQFWPISASADLPELRPCRGEVTPEKAAIYWATVLELARQEAQTLADGQYLEVRFEDLVARTPEVLGRICEFIGEPYFPDMDEEFNMTRHNIGRWRQEFTADEIKQMQVVFGDELEAQGYEI